MLTPTIEPHIDIDNSVPNMQISTSDSMLFIWSLILVPSHIVLCKWFLSRWLLGRESVSWTMVTWHSVSGQMDPRHMVSRQILLPWYMVSSQMLLPRISKH